ELFAHAEALGALAGEQVGELAFLGFGGDEVGGGSPLGESAERREQLFAVCSKSNRSVLEGAAGGEERVGDVGGVGLGVVLQVGCESLRGLGQGGLCFGREGEGDRAREERYPSPVL